MNRKLSILSCLLANLAILVLLQQIKLNNLGAQNIETLKLVKDYTTKQTTYDTESTELDRLQTNKIAEIWHKVYNQ